VAAAEFACSGDAYGTKVSVGNTVTSGRSAPVALGCGTTPGIRKTNTVASVDASPLLTSGTVSTTAGTFASPTKSRTSATVQDVNLVSGLITATAVKSVSSTIHDGTGFSTSDNGTTFTNLKIGTLSVDATVAPNTRIDILGGYVILNEQVEKIGARSASLTVNAIHVFLDDGTEIIVAHARSGLKGPVVGTLDGYAYGSKVVLGSGLVTSGPSFRQGLPCLGTNGKLRVNEGVGVSVGSLLDTGTIRNTATGTVNATTADGETTSTVQSANVLDGLVSSGLRRSSAGRRPGCVHRRQHHRSMGAPASIDEIAEQGYGLAVRERDNDLSAVAVPVLDGDRRLIAILGVQGPATRFDAVFMTALVPALCDRAAVIAAAF